MKRRFLSYEVLSQFSYFLSDKNVFDSILALSVSLRSFSTPIRRGGSQILSLSVVLWE